MDELCCEQSICIAIESAQLLVYMVQKINQNIIVNFGIWQ